MLFYRWGNYDIKIWHAVSTKVTWIWIPVCLTFSLAECLLSSSAPAPGEVKATGGISTVLLSTQDAFT